MRIAVIYIENKMLYYKSFIKEELTKKFIENPNIQTFKEMTKGNHKEYQVFKQCSGNYLYPYDMRRDQGIILLATIGYVVNTMNEKVIIEYRIDDSNYDMGYINIEPNNRSFMDIFIDRVE